MKVSCVTIDCEDPGRMTAFWSEALGYEVHGQSCHPPDGMGLELEFIVVPEPKTVKNRVHLGFNTTDLDAEIERLKGLGATLAWEEDFPVWFRYRNVVMRDPEGNEFCLGTSQGVRVKALAEDASAALGAAAEQDLPDEVRERVQGAKQQMDLLAAWPP